MTAPPDPHDSRFSAPEQRPPIDPGRDRLEERRTSTPAVVGLVLAIVGFCFWPLGIIAAVLGIVGLGDIRRNAGRVSGDMLAWLAIGFGGLETLATVVVAVLVAFGAATGLKQFAGPVRAASAATMLEQLAAGQRSMRAAGHLDADNDGVGEYGELADVGKFSGTEVQGLTDPATAEFLGYRLHFMLPESTDEREQHWHAVFEPTAEGNGLPWLYIDESSVLRMSFDAAGMPTRADAQDWEVTTSQGLTQSLIEDRLQGD